MALIGGHGRRRSQPSGPTPTPSPAMQLPPRDLRTELLVLFGRYGREAVVTEFERLTKKRNGRPRLNDLELLDEQFELDARALLEGKNPQEVTSNRRIAIKLSGKLAAGKSELTQESTVDRIERILRDNRAERLLWKVIMTEGKGYPHSAYISALRWRFPTKPNKFRLSDSLSNLSMRLADRAEATVSRYSERLGEPPGALTLAEIEAALESWVPPMQHLTAMSPDPESPLGVLWCLAEEPPKT